MQIIYKNSTAEKQFSSKYKAKWKYPEQVKTKLLAAENAFIAATSLKDIATYPPYRFHLLVGDRKGKWSVSLGNTGYRITLIPCNNQGVPLLSGDIMAECTTIKVVMVTEVSNHYE